MVAICSFFFWLAVQFWTNFEPAHIRFLAFIPALLMFFVMGMWFDDWIQILLGYFFPNTEISRSLVGKSTFFSLLAGGVVYHWSKRLLFKLLERTELIKLPHFRNARKQYFGWLALFFWGAISSVFQLLDNLGYINMIEDWWAPFVLLLAPLLLAVIFYKLCVHLFVTRPLKRLQPESAGDCLRSQA